MVARTDRWSSSLSEDIGGSHKLVISPYYHGFMGASIRAVLALGERTRGADSIN